VNTDRTLVVGWFSFELMGTTAGDAIAKDIACSWLRKHGITPQVAVTSPVAPDEIRTDDVVPKDYRVLIFVCGPIGDGPPLNTFLNRFPHALKFALNVSLLQDRAEWNPFVSIVERDSAVRTNPDITFAADELHTPVVALIYVGPQKEYPTQKHDLAEAAFAQVLKGRDVASISIDTRLDVNSGGLSTPSQIESLIAKMDAVLTTRLHGAAIALRRGVPAVVIDSIPGGTKLWRQMKCIGWPLVFHTGDLDVRKVASALDFALTPAARNLALECAQRARQDVQKVEREFLFGLRNLNQNA
jgi:Polysaccharide pyruvyl transferase